MRVEAGQVGVAAAVAPRDDTNLDACAIFGLDEQRPARVALARVKIVLLAASAKLRCFVLRERAGGGVIGPRLVALFARVEVERHFVRHRGARIRALVLGTPSNHRRRWDGRRAHNRPERAVVEMYSLRAAIGRTKAAGPRHELQEARVEAVGDVAIPVLVVDDAGRLNDLSAWRVGHALHDIVLVHADKDAGVGIAAVCGREHPVRRDERAAAEASAAVDLARVEAYKEGVAVRFDRAAAHDPRSGCTPLTVGKRCKEDDESEEVGWRHATACLGCPPCGGVSLSCVCAPHV